MYHQRIDSGGVVEKRDLLMITNGFRGRDGCECNGLKYGQTMPPKMMSSNLKSM